MAKVVILCVGEQINISRDCIEEPVKSDDKVRWKKFKPGCDITISGDKMQIMSKVVSDQTAKNIKKEIENG